MWHDPTLSVVSAPATAAPSPVGTPSSSRQGLQEPVAIFGSSGYAAALRRLARQAESAGSLAPDAAALGGRHDAAVDACRRVLTTTAAAAPSLLAHVCGSDLPRQVVPALHEGVVASTKAVPPVTNQAEHLASGVGANSNLVYPHYPASLAAGFPAMFGYSRSAEGLANIAGEVSADVGLARGGAAFASSHPQYFGWPLAVATAADAAAMTARMCLLHVMNYPEVMHRHLLLQQLLAQSQAALSSSIGRDVSSGYLQPSEQRAQQQSTSERLIGESEIKQEPSSCPSNGAVGFRPYLAANHSQARKKCSHLRREVSSSPTVPTTESEEMCKEQQSCSSLDSRRAVVLETMTFGSNGRIKVKAETGAFAALNLSAGMPSLASNDSLLVDHGSAMHQRPLDNADQQEALTTGIMRADSQVPQFSELDLNEAQQRQHFYEDSSMSSDEDNVEGEDHTLKHLQRLMVIRTALPPRSATHYPPLEKLGHLRLLDLVPVSEACWVRHTVARRRRAFHSEPELQVEGAEPSLRRLLPRSSDAHEAFDDGAAPRPDKCSFLRQLELTSRTKLGNGNETGVEAIWSTHESQTGATHLNVKRKKRREGTDAVVLT